MVNAAIAEGLEKMGYLLSQEGDRWRAIAYKKAADSVKHCGVDISNWSVEQLIELPNVGKSIASTILEIIKNGQSSKLKELEKGKPPYSIRTMEKIPGVGPKTALSLWKTYGVADISQLEVFLDKMAVFGCFGDEQSEECQIFCPHIELCKKSEKWLKLADGIRFAKVARERMAHNEAVSLATSILATIQKFNPKKLSFAGSVRRYEYGVKDVDILVCLPHQKDREDLASAVGSSYNENKIPIVVETDDGPRKIDINFTTPSSWGTYINYFTGSRDFNIRLRQLALKRGITVNEHRLEATKNITVKGKSVKIGDVIPCPEEKDLFAILGIPFVPPECRVDGSEIGLDLSHLVNEVKGDVHIHSKISDGLLSPEDIVSLAKKQKFEFLGFSEHTSSVGIAAGLKTDKDVERYVSRIKKLQAIPVYAGAEVDVSVDLDIDLFSSLHKLDFAIIALHMAHDRRVESRFIEAMDKIKIPKILAHPTGRLYGQREEAKPNWELIFKIASKTNTAIEINASPYRMDLPANLIRVAKDYGVKFFIASDFHGGSSIDHTYGIMTARKGLLDDSDVINSSLGSFTSWIKGGGVYGGQRKL